MGKVTEQVSHPNLVSGAETDLHSHPGGGGGLHSDMVIHSHSTSKAWEPFVWNQTFSAAPTAMAFGADPSSPGKKCGVKDITTTGGSVYYELAGDVVIFGRELGYE